MRPALRLCPPHAYCSLDDCLLGVHPPLVAIRFSLSVQLVFRDLLSRHGGGGTDEVAQEGDRD